MDCVLIERGAVPVIETKYEFVHKVGNARLSSVRETPGARVTKNVL